MKTHVNFSGKTEEEIAQVLVRGTDHRYQPRDWTPAPQTEQQEEEIGS